MRAAYVTMLFPFPSETFASNDARELAARGIELTVHSLRPATAETPRLVAQRDLGRVGVSYHTGLNSVMRGLSMALRQPRVAIDLLAAVVTRCATRPSHLLKSLVLVPRALEIFEALRTERPDVVHAFWSHYPSMVVYLVQRHLPGVVTSISFGAYDIVLRYGLSATVAHRADLVRTLARVNLGQIERRFGVPAASIEVIHNGVDFSLLPPPADRVPRSILTAGRLIEKKGMHHVVRAFANLHRQWPGSTLRVLGAGPALPRLRAVAEELGVASAVTFVGHVAQRDVLQEMRRAEVFLFLSETASERLPNVVKEAMVCGCVCVVSDTDGIEELVTHGETGFVVARGDVDAAVGHVADVFAGRVRSHDMAKAAEASIRRDFDLQTSVRRYEALWTDLVRRKRAARAQIHER